MHRSKRKASRAPDLAIAVGDVVVLVLPVAAFAGEVGAAMADLPNRHERASGARRLRRGAGLSLASFNLTARAGRGRLHQHLERILQPELAGQLALDLSA